MPDQPPRVGDLVQIDIQPFSARVTGVDTNGYCVVKHPGGPGETLSIPLRFVRLTESPGCWLSDCRSAPSRKLVSTRTRYELMTCEDHLVKALSLPDYRSVLIDRIERPE